MLGLIGKKIGMTQVFDQRGVLTPVTIIQIEDNVIVGERTVEKDGYTGVIIGAGDLKKRRALTKPYVGQFKEGVSPKKHLMEIRDWSLAAETGDVLSVGLFTDLGFVDVVGTSKGKGFQGAMKRHNFSGGPASHGSKFHRGLGGTGMAATPARTHKGTKMPGRMGDEQVTVQNLKVLKVDPEKKVILVKGAIPGPKSSMVIVKKAKKK